MILYGIIIIDVFSLYTENERKKEGNRFGIDRNTRRYAYVVVYVDPNFIDNTLIDRQLPI